MQRCCCCCCCCCHLYGHRHCHRRQQSKRMLAEATTTRVERLPTSWHPALCRQNVCKPVAAFDLSKVNDNTGGGGGGHPDSANFHVTLSLKLRVQLVVVFIVVTHLPKRRYGDFLLVSFLPLPSFFPSRSCPRDNQLIVRRICEVRGGLI